jgi:hypothetical protein
MKPSDHYRYERWFSMACCRLQGITGWDYQAVLRTLQNPNAQRLLREGYELNVHPVQFMDGLIRTFVLDMMEEELDMAFAVMESENATIQ